MENNLVIIPALLALIIKLHLLISSRKSARDSGWFAALLVICTLLSVSEVVTFFLYMLELDVNKLFRFYYILLISWLTIAFIYTSSVTQTYNVFVTPIVVLAIGVILSILFTDLVISGYYDIGYSITAIREIYYYIYQILVVGLIITSITLLLIAIYRNKCRLIKVRSLYLLLAFFAPFSVILGVTALMALNIKINMLMLLPLSTALFLYLVVQSEKKHRLTDLRRLMPYSDEYKFAEKMTRIADQVSLDNLSLKEADKMFQAALIQYQRKQNANNITHTAESLGISTSTLYSKLKALGFDIQK